VFFAVRAELGRTCMSFWMIPMGQNTECAPGSRGEEDPFNPRLQRKIREEMSLGFNSGKGFF